MSRIGIGYEIGRFTGVCAATGEPLEPGTPCVATLSEATAEDGSPADGFARHDFGVAAWEAGHRPDRLFSWWRTVVPHPEARKRLLVDDSVLMDLLIRLEGDDAPARMAFRFVLALILLRRRQVRQVGRERITITRRLEPSRVPSDHGPSEESPELASGGDGDGGGTKSEAANSPRSEPSAPQTFDTEIWLLVPRGAAEGDPPLRVVDPCLGPDDVAVISEQLGEVLHGDL